MANALFDTGATNLGLVTEAPGMKTAPAGKSLCLAGSGLTLSSSPTSLVWLRLRSVGDLIGQEGTDGSVLDRLGGKGALTARVPGDVEGVLVGCTAASAARAAASLINSFDFFTNRCHFERSWGALVAVADADLARPTGTSTAAAKLSSVSHGGVLERSFLILANFF